jgi:hypothetical protein
LTLPGRHAGRPLGRGARRECEEVAKELRGKCGKVPALNAPAARHELSSCAESEKPCKSRFRGEGRIRTLEGRNRPLTVFEASAWLDREPLEYVIDGSVTFGIDGREPVELKAGESFYEPPGALHSVSRNASQDAPASLIAFFVLSDGESGTVYDRD